MLGDAATTGREASAGGGSTGNDDNDDDDDEEVEVEVEEDDVDPSSQSESSGCCVAEPSSPTRLRKYDKKNRNSTETLEPSLVSRINHLRFCSPGQD